MAKQARKRDYAAEYRRRQEAAKARGFSGYAEERRLRKQALARADVRALLAKVDKKERPTALAFLARYAGVLGEFVKGKPKMHTLPDFLQDWIDDLSEEYVWSIKRLLYD